MWMDVDAALAEVPVNCVALIDDTDFKSREESVAYNAAGLELIWHFTTTAGDTSATVVTPTTGGDYDWAHQDGGLYTIEIPATDPGGGSIWNDTEGFGFFSGKADGVLPWSGPIIGFRAAALNDALVDGGDYLQTDLTQIGGQAINGYNATLKLKQLDIQNNAGSAFVAKGVAASGTNGIELVGFGSGHGLSATGGTAANGINAKGGAVSGAGIKAAAQGNNDAGMELIKHGAGKDLDADDLAEVTAARMGALTDLIDGGRLDLLIDAILLDTGTTLENRQVTIATDAARLTAARAAVLTDWINGGRLDLILDIIAADTTTDIPALLATIAGYIDTEVQAIKDKTDNLPGSPAAVGSEMNLADAAITAAKIAAAAFTSAKYDGSTAFPVSEKQSKAASTIVLGTVSWDNTNATTTVIYSDDITEATADHYNGRIMIYLTGALAGQATDITDYELVAGEGKFTVTALTEAPADNDTFIIV